MNKYFRAGLFSCAFIFNTAFAVTAADCKAWDDCVKQNCCSGQASLNSPFAVLGMNLCAQETQNADYQCNAKLYATNPISMAAPNTNAHTVQKNNLDATHSHADAPNKTQNKTSSKKSSISWF